MNARSTVHTTLGLGAVLALVAGCSHEEPPPRAQTTPTFESRLPAPQDQRAPVIALPPTEEPVPQAAPVPEAPPQEAAPPQANERQMCDEIGRDAKITVKDIQGGSLVTAIPRNGASHASVERDATRIADGMVQVKGAGAPTGDSKENCVIFDVGRQGGSAVVSESGDSVLITITTSDPTAVKALRAQVKEFVKVTAGTAQIESKDKPTTRDLAGEKKPGANDPGDAGRGSPKDKATGHDTSPQKTNP